MGSSVQLIHVILSATSAYTTPNTQFATTVSFAMESRRVMLLWAANRGLHLVEKVGVTKKLTNALVKAMRIARHLTINAMWARVT